MAANAGHLRQYVVGFVVGVCASYAAFKAGRGRVINTTSVTLDHPATKHGLPGGGDDLLLNDSYVVAYNRRLRNANYSIEHLSGESLSRMSATRTTSQFRPDPRIPEKFRSDSKDYLHSGYDRGHLVPSADSRHSQKAMDETFFLSNISPQVGNGFNRDYWARLESFTRHLAKKYGDVYVATGPVFMPRKDESDGNYYVKYRVLGSPPTVAVPTHFFKSILVERSDGNAVVGSFLIPNQPIAENTPIQKFSVSLDFLEEVSGLVFWPKCRGMLQYNNLPKREVEEAIAQAKKALPLGELCKETACNLPPKYVEKKKE